MLKKEIKIEPICFDSAISNTYNLTIYPNNKLRIVVGKQGIVYTTDKKEEIDQYTNLKNYLDKELSSGKYEYGDNEELESKFVSLYYILVKECIDYYNNRELSLF